jgi:hypothetical protein
MDTYRNFEVVSLEARAIQTVFRRHVLRVPFSLHILTHIHRFRLPQLSNSQVNNPSKYASGCRPCLPCSTLSTRLVRDSNRPSHLVMHFIITSFDERSSGRLRFLLGCIAFAQRPLKKLEFISAVPFSQGDPTVKHPAPLSILDIIASLVEVRSNTTLGFSHVSVREYLDKIVLTP